MMNPRLFPGLFLLASLLAACAPATSTVSPVQFTTAEAPATVPPTLTMDAASQVTAVQTLPATPFPIATSRGPNLEASDPTTVNMASGGLQLVEFFEFW